MWGLRHGPCRVAPCLPCVSGAGRSTRVGFESRRSIQHHSTSTSHERLCWVMSLALIVCFLCCTFDQNHHDVDATSNNAGRNLLTEGEQQDQKRGEDWWKAPLVMSTVAGMSTALGAAIVFFFPKQQKKKKTRQGGNRTPSWDMDSSGAEDTTVVVSPNVLCFSLSLAGSVMVTVSVISLLPQCFLSEDGNILPISVLATRLVSLGLGCALYKLLSRTFPEPDDVLWGGHDGIESAQLTPLVNGEAEILNDATASSDGTNTCPVGSSTEIEMNQTQHSASAETTMGNSASIFRPTVTRRTKSTSSSQNDAEMGSEEREHLLSPTRTSSSIQRSSSGEDPKDTNAEILRSRSTGSGAKEFFTDETMTIQTRRGSPSKPPERAPSAFKRNNKGFMKWSFQGSDLQTSEQRKSWRIAMLLFVALLVHNFPEGLAVAASTAQSRQLGVTVTVGIMIHNIPEGIAIAVPCLRARPQEPWLAFVLATLSGLAEPLGAAVTVAFIEWFGFAPDDRPEGGTVETESLSSWTMGLEDVLAFVAGVMIMVAVCELFPEARRHMKNRSATKSDPANAASFEEEAPAVIEQEPSASMSAFVGGLISGFLVMFITEHYLPE